MPHTKSSISEYYITTSTSAAVSTSTFDVPSTPSEWFTSPPVLHPSATKKKAALHAAALEANGPALASELMVYYKRNQVPGRYEEGHHHNGETAYQNLQDLLARFFISVHYNAGPISNWREWCVGMTSFVTRDNLGRKLPENRHLPMFDYDGKNIKSIVRKDVQQLQKKWGLGPATLFQTKKGFHVYFMTDMVTWGAYQSMLSEVNCCAGFRKCAFDAGYAVLRVSAKYSTFDITLDSVMHPEIARDFPFRKTRKARIIEAILSLGERCGTHFASLCPEWAHYREDAVPWKQPTKSKRMDVKALIAPGGEAAKKALKGPLYNFSPENNGESAGKPKSKMVLKPRAPRPAMSVVEAAARAEPWAPEKYYNPKLNPPSAYPIKYDDSGAIAERMSNRNEYIRSPLDRALEMEGGAGVPELSTAIENMNKAFSNSCRDTFVPPKNESVEFKKYKSVVFDNLNYVQPSESPSVEIKSYAALQKDVLDKIQKDITDKIREMAGVGGAQELEDRQFFHQSPKDLADET